MSARKHNYQALEPEYVFANPKVSIRALCRKHEIKGYSAVAQYAREHDWDGKWERANAKRENKLVDQVTTKLATAEADLIETVRHEWLTVIRAATYKFAEDLKKPDYMLKVDDLVRLIDKGLVLLGEPSSRTEERHLALTGSLDGVPQPILRELAKRTRSVGPDAGRTGLPTRPDPEDPRPN